MGREEEHQLYSAPKDETFYNSLALSCVESAISVDILAVGSPFVDLATLAQMPSTTGGFCDRITVRRPFSFSVCRTNFFVRVRNVRDFRVSRPVIPCIDSPWSDLFGDVCRVRVL